MKEDIFGPLFEALPGLTHFHPPGSPTYRFLQASVRRETERLFSAEDASADFGPLGKLHFPFHKMGNITSLNLFEIDELIIFSFYWANRSRYKKVLDIGANIGLHSIVLSKCGYQVQSFEPDPVHYEILQRNLRLNGCERVEAINAAVSSQRGTLDFIRVLGNTTGSHIAGAKDNPYGELEKFAVKVEAFEPLIAWADLIKLDAEGHEKEILFSAAPEHWNRVDALVEVGSAKNAEAIFSHFKALGVGLFAQKSGWGLVEKVEGMPISHHDGTLFISSKSEVPWKA